ncbi:MAG: hypothetical protein IJR54_02315 [Oscillibacter sp.]|nr:hypothetical protein [Oscillibacter sp.]
MEMPKENWSESLDALSAKLDELSRKAAEAAESAKAAQQEKAAELDAKIRDAKGDFVALQEQVREASERNKSKLFSELLKARMTVEAKLQDRKDAKDRQRLERYITDQITRAADCHDAALVLIAEAKLSVLEAFSAAVEYEEKFGDSDK